MTRISPEGGDYTGWSRDGQQVTWAQGALFFRQVVRFANNRRVDRIDLTDVVQQPSVLYSDHFSVWQINIFSDESGQGLVEYVLIIAVVAIGLIAALYTFRNKIGNTFDSVSNSLNNQPSNTYGS